MLMDQSELTTGDVQVDINTWNVFEPSELVQILPKSMNCVYIKLNPHHVLPLPIHHQVAWKKSI